MDLDFGENRITIENVHIIFGLIIFYLIILRLINNILNPTPKIKNSSFAGQIFIARLNHFLLYITILLITGSGILKKLFVSSVKDYHKADINLFWEDIRINSINRVSNYLNEN